MIAGLWGQLRIGGKLFDALLQRPYGKHKHFDLDVLVKDKRSQLSELLVVHAAI